MWVVAAQFSDHINWILSVTDEQVLTIMEKSEGHPSFWLEIFTSLSFKTTANEKV